ncbi:MAG: tetratricopeptide repeat protein [Dehalococcoidia bacterium]|nr:tetratricopeptide repeat protein [Dehalococcoidia bacterium]
MIRVMLSRLAERVRAWRHFLFKISRPLLTVRAVTLYQIGYANQLAERGEHDEAIAIFGEIIDSNSGFPLPPLYSLRGQLHTLKLSYDKALADFNEAINLNEADGFDELHQAYYEDYEVEVGLYLARGQLWASLREYERAVDDFNIVIESEPSAEAYSARSEAMAAMGKYIAAMDDCERVIRRQPDADAYMARGNVYLCLDLLDDALDDFNRATQFDPDGWVSYAMRGRIYLQQGDHGAAIEEFTQVIALMADSFDADFLKFANTNVKSRLYDLAVQTVGGAYCVRGISKSRTGDIAGALSDFDAAIGNMPEHASFYLARAVAYAEHGKHAEAMQDLEVASRLDSRSADTHCIRAWVHFCGKEFDEALQACHVTIGLSPHWATVYCLRGLVHLRLGDYRDAIDDFGRAIELGPGKPQSWQDPWYAHTPSVTAELILDRRVAYANRGLAFLMLGNEAKGREDIVESVELGYTQSKIDDEIEALSSDEEERRTMREFASDAVDEARAEQHDRLWTTAFKKRNSGRHTENEATPGTSSTGELMSLSKEAYTDMFQRLGFYDIKVGRTLKHPEPLPSIYFNSRYGVVYFVAYAKDRERFRPGFWRLVRPRRTREDQDNLITVVPKAGREWDAFERILAGDAVSDESSEQAQVLTVRIMVNDYRERKSRDTVNGEPVGGVIHLAACRHVPKDPGQWWVRFNSLEAAQAVFGIRAATCTACLAGEGKHLDRVQQT